MSADLDRYSIATEITGPTTVNGLERGSDCAVCLWLTMGLRCAYGSQWETYLKWWCRGAVWSSCEILVKTTGSEQEVKRDRLSIRDDQKNHAFTVTMKDLRRDDADTYWCGIERTGTDLGVKVQVTIDPGTQNSAPEWTTTTASLARTAAATPKTTAPITRSLLRSTHFLVLVLLELPLFLSMLGAILWVNRSPRRS
ncbi:LOW QUALITY PROTEIN: CMRF35-like molecule 5 [Cebus imitator]|uniref:LOW QUALITY PROTEIN: CMRF35-like molecule 5 n=1 Tax=Cebus imitator TaxID=2715852 RepID=UPI00080A4250|nr:LOW QUALITY PROTEIN: CMRF35-like molecule 5 [Cebus imitator]